MYKKRQSQRIICRWPDPITTWPPKKYSTEGFLELINKFSNAERYSANTHKSTVFLYTNKEVMEKEIRKAVLFTMTLRKMKYLRLNLTKEVEELYNQNYITL